MPGCLYRLTFPNGKSYIGCSRHGIEWRRGRHRRAAAKAGATLLYRAWRKFGEESIRVEVLMVADDIHYLWEVEIRAIALFGTRSPDGYNMTSGGEGITGITAELIARRRQIAADPAWRADMANIQRQLWDEDKRQERAASVTALWAGEYGERLRAKHRRRPSKPKQPLLTPAERSRRQVEGASRPETRLKMAASARRASLARRASISATQTALMAAEENRLRIAKSLSPLSDKRFVKLRCPVRGNFLRMIWDRIEPVSTFDDLYRIGFRGNALQRSLRNGNLRIEDAAP